MNNCQWGMVSMLTYCVLFFQCEAHNYFYICLHTYIEYLDLQLSTCPYIYIYTYTYINIYIYTHTYIYIHIYSTYICIHIYICMTIISPLEVVDLHFSIYTYKYLSLDLILSWSEHIFSNQKYNSISTDRNPRMRSFSWMLTCVCFLIAAAWRLC